MTSNFIAYLTANDDSSYTKDMLNFTNMAKFNPGVEHIDLFIAISEVRPFTDSDIIKVQHLARILKNCEWISVKSIILKANTGRDFSSAHVCLNEIAKHATDQDIVMVKNRSGYGPLCPDWFKAYSELLHSHPETGLVGSTINFSGHPKKKSYGIKTHVQTYVYMSYWKYFNEILDTFPAIKCTDRTNLIVEGELGLSTLFLKRGLSLACLAWPNHLFSLSRLTDSSLPQNDIKHKVKSIPIRYKYDAYGRWCILAKIKWYLLIWCSQGITGTEEIVPVHNLSAYIGDTN